MDHVSPVCHHTFGFFFFYCVFSPFSALGQMTQLCELINKSGELLAKNLSHLDTVLGALDIQEHSLGVLAVL